jgi:sortase (surface protein transpeptidase)
MATAPSATPPRRRSSPRFIFGLALLALGVLLLGSAGAYYGYIEFIATRNSESLTVAPLPERSETLQPSTPPAQPVVAGRPAPAWTRLYPGSLLPVRQWADPRGTLDLGTPELDGFTPVSAEGRPSIVGGIGRAERISIPALDIVAEISELAIENLGDSRAYETPNDTVGHIPDSPNPGSRGNGWYFGHLESPLQGEGNVFSRLPRVPELLRAGEDVHVVLESEGREYLYLVSETNLIHQDDMSLYQAADSRITLVTCFPRLRYDQRLLVTAQLIGFRDAPRGAA